MKWEFFRRNWKDGLMLGIMLLIWFAGLWFWILVGLQ